MGVSPEDLIDPPKHKTPGATLVGSSEFASSDDDRWEGGISFQPEGCVEASAWDPCSVDIDRVKAGYSGNQVQVDFNPYVLIVAYTCSTFGFQAADYEGRVMRSLDRSFHKALEREFWLGEKVATNQALVRITNDDDHILNPGGANAPTAVTPAEALVLLTAGLANCNSGSVGMIHASPRLAEIWFQQTLIHRNDDGSLVTGVRGDIIVSGAGYTGDAPEDQDASAGYIEWAYATGLVDVKLGDPIMTPSNIAEAMDRSINEVTFFGERTAAAYHDGCCHLAVKVDTTPAA